MTLRCRVLLPFGCVDFSFSDLPTFSSCFFGGVPLPAIPLSKLYTSLTFTHPTRKLKLRCAKEKDGHIFIFITSSSHRITSACSETVYNRGETSNKLCMMGTFTLGKTSADHFGLLCVRTVPTDQ